MKDEDVYLVSDVSEDGEEAVFEYVLENFRDLR